MSDIPDGWVVCPIGEVAQIETGNTPSKKQPEFFGGQYPFYKPGDMDVGGVLADAVETLSKQGYAVARQLPEGSVLVTCIGNLGKSGITSSPSACNQQINAILPTGAAMPEFLNNWVKTIRPWMEENASATTVTILNKGRFSTAPLPLPPLPEQQRIVAKLDRLSARSAAARDHLARTTKLATRAKQAILEEAYEGRLTEEWRSANGTEYPWVGKTIGEIAQVVTGNTPPTKNQANYGDEYPFVKPGDLDKGIISVTENHLSSDGYAVARQLPADTVLVSCIGNLGKIGVLAREGSCNQQINALLPSEDLLPRFTYWWAHTIRAWLEENSSATTVAIINKGRFSRAPISVPSIEEQAEIVRRVEAAFARIDRMTGEASRAAHLLERLDERLLAKAFRGELVPQNPDDEPAEALLTRIREARAANPKAKRGRRKAMA